MRLNFALFAAGIWLLQWAQRLPALEYSLPLFPLLLYSLPKPRAPALKVARTGAIGLFFFGAGFFYAAMFATLRLGDCLPAEWEGAPIELVGVVSEMPLATSLGQRFCFDVEQVVTPRAKVPKRIMLSRPLDDGRQAVHAGSRYLFEVKLRRPHGNSNPYGFDYEAWLLERAIGATGYVLEPGQRLANFVPEPGYWIERARERIRSRIASLGLSGVLAALAVGDQGSISDAEWRVFRRSGVIHLMSISGLHVTMVSGLFSALVFWLWRRFPGLVLKLPARKAAALFGVSAALGYAELAGFSVPTQRTLYMLAAVAAMLWFGRIGSASGVLSVALAVVLLHDPWAVLSPGFWLSFAAVACIFYATAGRIGRPSWFWAWLNVQWAVSIGLVPLLLMLFGQVSLVSPISNAIAIPLVSLVVVPLTLAGSVLPFDFPLELADFLFHICFSIVRQLSAVPAAVWVQHSPPLWSVFVAAIGVFWILLPRGFPARAVGLAGFMPMFMSLPELPQTGALRLTVLDVGQGLAVVARTENHALLFDAGPAFGTDSDAGSRIIVPFLQGAGIKRLDAMILSHADIDHVGGANSVFDSLPVARLITSLPAGNRFASKAEQSIRCRAGMNWQWDRVKFEILSPAAESDADTRLRRNFGSCVLRISSAAGSILIGADIEKSVERALIGAEGENLQSDLLIVPHHGGLSASSSEFVQKVRPAFAIFSAGYRNRFGHPRPEVVARYRKIGSRIYRTDQDGAVVVDLSEKISVESWRKTHRRYWFTTP